ncbi:hypothetical protein [Calothrix sp. PCC 7507]|uniref:hypothetical protein n=1 Tax=Calothrix sp. PCC 7507 TaxID=99598 RepID=UPI00191718D5|nr:hypothetical protein [Calothrix sp. PCC 7507]
MLMKIWVATVLLSSSWLISGVMAAEPISANSLLAQKPVATPANSSNPQAITVNKAEFGVERVDSPGKFTFIPTMRVPFREGNRYGWRIQLKDYKGEVTWKEILRLPKRPETWGTTSTENFAISPTGEEAVTTRTVKTTDGVIKNFWTITPGDPPGKHKIEVYAGDRLLGSFDFEITQIKTRI